jgi:hypothetical protein
VSDDRMLEAAKDSGLAKPTEEIDWGGWGKTEIEDDDLRTARIAIVQPTSDVVKEGLAAPGVFWNSAFNRSFGNRGSFIPLGYFSGRMLIEERKVLCRSIDRVNGVPEEPAEGQEKFQPRDKYGKPTLLCANCTMSKWVGRRQPPPCNVTYTYPILWIAGENYWNAFLTFRGTANDAARIMNGDHMADNSPWHYFVYEAEPQRRENAKGWWFVWKVKRSRPTSEEERQYAVARGKELAARGDLRQMIEGAEAEEEEVPL